MINKKGKRKMKKGLKLFLTMLLVLTVAMSAVLPTVAFAQGDVEVCNDEQFVTHYKYDENGRLMFRIWSIAYDYWITDWEYV